MRGGVDVQDCVRLRQGMKPLAVVAAIRPPGPRKRLSCSVQRLQHRQLRRCLDWGVDKLLSIRESCRIVQLACSRG